MPGIELTFSRGQQQLFNPLSHNRNSLKDVNTDFKISCDFSIGPLGWAHCYQAPGFFPLSFEIEIVWLPDLLPHQSEPLRVEGNDVSTFISSASSITLGTE